MEEKIELLREKLNKLTEECVCLYSDEVVELSQRLDKLIYKYYQNIQPI
ncbi:aspartyl-phosphate phosphatase Spo0E family protein [Clostridium thailandense]|uniref:Aspartyl-phosphate phosphatase Spo0E family protein n=1 Tax=Clostridium thailandense TaxID=2794346 RepID=A0A949WRH6_9CLOT|nr:aspartyl-phosphate phosphatase Spo0E family protein [Clostridium thailandense]MBV7274040.1 aspartyl-phosphate phosphatase Spo0E family protein [Clostridium thailandense]